MLLRTVSSTTLVRSDRLYPAAQTVLSVGSEGRVNTVRHGSCDPYTADGASAVTRREPCGSACHRIHACDIGWVKESFAGSVPCAGNAGRQRVAEICF